MAYLMAMLFVAGAVAGAEAETPAGATLTVEVVHGTADGAPVAGDELVVQVYQHEQLVSSFETQIDANGIGVLEDVPTGQHMRAVARVRHQNMVFTSRPVALLPSLNAVSASVQVFDVSEDASQLSVGTHHVTIALSASALTCSEYMQLTNPSDKAIKGSEREAKLKTSSRRSPCRPRISPSSGKAPQASWRVSASPRAAWSTRRGPRFSTFTKTA